MTDRTPSVFDIQAGEGGEDSKLFVRDLSEAYLKYAAKNGLKLENSIWDHGKISLIFIGDDLTLFIGEAGKHVIQRIPPTERSGRRQTSVVTVAVTFILNEKEFKLNMDEVNIETKKGGGAGGQHKNKTESMIRVTHKPTGLQASVDGRDQHQNKRSALRLLAARVKDLEDKKRHQKEANIKKSQVGYGNRSDKIRTYNFINSRAVDHRSGVKTSKVEDVIYKGRFDLLK